MCLKDMNLERNVCESVICSYVTDVSINLFPNQCLYIGAIGNFPLGAPCTSRNEICSRSEPFWDKGLKHTLLQS